MTIEVKDGGAKFTEDRKHRLFLWRIWDESKPFLMFIGLNPSSANETDSDPTIKSVMRIAEYNGYGGIYMVNCWSFVATNPNDLQFESCMDENNKEVLQAISQRCKDVVFAWGNFKIVKEYGMDEMLFKMFPNAKALHINKNGSPKHPLYCKSDTKLIQYKP